MRYGMIPGLLLCITSSVALSQVQFVLRTVSADVDITTAILAVDLDGDGDVDILSTSYDEERIIWHENDGAETFTSHTVTSHTSQPIAIHVADLDGDDDIDIVSASGIDNKIAWHENQENSSFLDHEIIGAARYPNDVHTVDLDGDGDIDVLSSSAHDNSIAWHENDGNGLFTSHRITTKTEFANSVDAADFDNDGDMDLLTSGDHNIVWLENDGNQVFVLHRLTDEPWIPSSQVADMDGDGDADIISFWIEEDQIVWYENDGSGSFKFHSITNVTEGINSVYPADLDGDGDMDVVATLNFDGQIVWYENDGSERFGRHGIMANLEGPSSAYAADINGDNAIDVLVGLNTGAPGRDRVLWLESVGLNQGVYATVRTTPDSGDGTFLLGTEVKNLSAQARSLDLWMTLTDPYGNEKTTLISEGMTLPPGEQFSRDTEKLLGPEAGVGVYALSLFVGTFPDMILGTAGTTYFKRDQTEYKLSASDGENEDYFGHSVSISGDYVVVGAHGDNDDLTGYDFMGSAYVFHRSGTEWIQEEKIRASDGDFSDFFGASVSVSGDYLIIGATGAHGFGSAYMFHREGTSWVEDIKLIPDDGESGDAFGSSVAIAGDHAIVAAVGDDDESGSAYIYRRESNTWILEQKIVPNDGNADDYFGSSVAISDDNTIIGSYLDDDNGDASGSAYVYRREGTGWILEAKLTPDDATAYHNFGRSVGIWGDQIIVGAPGGDESAYVFRKDGNDWIEEAKLIPSDGEQGDDFGWSVSISSGYALVGAYFDDDNGGASGSAYKFRKDGVAWVEERKITASDGEFDQWFGHSVSISGGTAVIGAPTGYGSWLGAAYVYDGFGGMSARITESVAQLEVSTVPHETSLLQNYPNPFNPSTTFRYALGSPGQVSIEVYDMLGQLVRTLVDEYQAEGYHEVIWDGRNESGASVAGGVYLYRMTAGSFADSRRMLFLK